MSSFIEKEIRIAVADMVLQFCASENGELYDPLSLCTDVMKFINNQHVNDFGISDSEVAQAIAALMSGKSNNAEKVEYSENGNVVYLNRKDQTDDDTEE